VGAKKVSIPRKVLLAKMIKWGKLAIRNACRQDQGLKGFQIARPFMSISETEIELRLF
jgi:hypothetical protein